MPVLRQEPAVTSADAACQSDTLNTLPPATVFELVAPDSLGTAFVSDIGLITAAHVVGDRGIIGVRTPGTDDPLVGARVSFVNEANDIAILEVPEDLQTSVLPWADQSPQIGDCVAAWGGVEENFGTHLGVVSSAGRMYVESSANVFPGNSGGPLVNAAGDVVGMVVSHLPGAEPPLSQAVSTAVIQKTPTPANAFVDQGGGPLLVVLLVMVGLLTALVVVLLVVIRRTRRKSPVIKITLDEETA